MKKLLFLPINILFWSFFLLSSVFLYLGALVIWLVTLPFDVNRRVLHKYSCFWASLYVWTNPFWPMRTRGKENMNRKKAYVIVSNHESMVDILVLFHSFLHFKWVSKASMFKAPFLGWNMKLNGYIPIERGDPKSRETCMEKCRDWIRKGSSVLFFPEGSRSKDGHLKKFKLGAFRLALETGADILPMVIRGTRNAVPKHSIILTKRSKISLEILPPISIKGFDGKKLPEEAERLAKLAWEKIQGALDHNPILSGLEEPKIAAYGGSQA